MSTVFAIIGHHSPCLWRLAVSRRARSSRALDPDTPTLQPFLVSCAPLVCIALLRQQGSQTPVDRGASLPVVYIATASRACIASPPASISLLYVVRAPARVVRDLVVMTSPCVCSSVALRVDERWRGCRVRSPASGGSLPAVMARRHRLWSPRGRSPQQAELSCYSSMGRGCRVGAGYHQSAFVSQQGVQRHVSKGEGTLHGLRLPAHHCRQ